MAQVPREAVDFARMVARAFYPPKFVILLDAVLRSNNYCTQRDLERRLGMQPKELRQILTRMIQARLMRNEKRQQKRINFRDEKRPTRTVNTEYWYVPLAEVLDAFSYRIHLISTDIEKKRTNEIQQQKYVCNRCNSDYQLLEILQETNNQGDFICPRMGVRLDRRPLPCGGLVKEEDNTAQIKEIERLQKLINEQLHPLRERAEQCAKLDIPVHPLDGADEETWGERVPEIVGVNGERVDEEGLTSEFKAEVDGNSIEQPIPIAVQPISNNNKTNDAIPDKPSWFKESTDKDDEDDWGNDQTEEHVLETANGTAASFSKEEDEKSYYERYLKEIVGEDPNTTQTAQNDTNGASQQTKQIETNNVQSTKDIPSNAQLSSTSNAENTIDKEPSEDPMVSVAGKAVKFSQVTEDMTQQMTTDEFRQYFAIAQKQENDSEDDDDF